MLRRMSVLFGCAGAICMAVPASAAVLFVEPIRASGQEGVDWVAGPGPHDLQLLRGDQMVEIKVFVEGYGSNEAVSAYATVIECDSLYSDEGSRAETLNVDCSIGQGQFGVDFCMGIDESDPAYL